MFAPGGGIHLATKSRQFRKLTDRFIEAAIDFGEGEPRVFWDATVHGLKIRIGRTRHSWTYFRQGRFRGDRYTVARRLGFYPSMGVIEARKAALALAGRIAEGKPIIGKRRAVTLDRAAADYIADLKKREKKYRFVESMLRVHLTPAFGKWTLAELSASPAAVRDWHTKISRDAPVSANRAAVILGTIYWHAKSLDRTLPPESPISGVTMNKEKTKQSAMPFDRFPEWRKAVEALPRVRQGYHRLLLLTGLRGQDLRRMKWSDVDLRTRSIAVVQQKTGASFSIPMTAAIAAALKLARPVHDGLIWPGARKWNDPLPYRGHDLRHTFISVAHDLSVNEIQVRLLVGHSLSGVHASYLTRMVMEGGPGLRAAQRKISRRMLALMAR